MKWLQYSCFFLSAILIHSCNRLPSAGDTDEPRAVVAPDTIKIPVTTGKPVNIGDTLPPSAPGQLERSLIDAGLVNVKDLDSTIQVDLKYSSTDNFLGIDVYGDLENCYLQPDVAKKLAVAQAALKKQYPYYRLIVYDGARPRSIQQVMWDTIQVEERERPKYLSNPKYGSLHNFGAAVDVSIVNEEGMPLDMGTPYDHFSELAYPEREEEMLSEGRLTQRQVLNRELLRSVMTEAGFFNIQTEWWHFNSCYREEARTKYEMLE